jgi:hypothetical protein
MIFARFLYLIRSVALKSLQRLQKPAESYRKMGDRDSAWSQSDENQI